MTFARFMDLALYDPAGGYYRAADARPGRDGDFLTAPGGASDLRCALSRASLDETWERLGEPAPFVLREYGAGDRDAGGWPSSTASGATGRGSGRRPPLRRRSRSSPAGSRRSRARLAEAGLRRDPRRCRGRGHADRRRRSLANEVLDALPVHRVATSRRRARRARRRRRRRPLRRGRGARRRRRPSRERLATEDDRPRRRPDAPRSASALDAWVADAAAGLARGLLLLIDYGAPGDRAVRPRPPPRRHASRLRPPPRPRRPVSRTSAGRT